MRIQRGIMIATSWLNVATIARKNKEEFGYIFSQYAVSAIRDSDEMTVSAFKHIEKGWKNKSGGHSC